MLFLLLTEYPFRDEKRKGGSLQGTWFWCSMRGRIANYIVRPKDTEPRAGFIRKDDKGPDIYFRVVDCIPPRRFDVNTRVEYEEKYDASTMRTSAVRVREMDDAMASSLSQISFRPGGRLGPCNGLLSRESKKTTLSNMESGSPRNQPQEKAQHHMRRLEGFLETKDFDSLVSNVSSLKSVFAAQDFNASYLQRSILFLGDEMIADEYKSDSLYRTFLDSSSIQTRIRTYVLNLQSSNANANPALATRCLCATFHVFYECFSRFPDDSAFLPVRELFDGFAAHLWRRKDDRALTETALRLPQFSRWLDLQQSLAFLVEVDPSLQSRFVKSSRPMKQQASFSSRHVIEPTDTADYRTMPILPTMAEVLEHKEFALERNKKTFASVHEYMQINFMLLREDFVHPIREGIRLYKERKHSPKDLHLYYGVRVVGYTSGRDGLLVRIRLPHMPNVRWETTKRLLNGALLCFSDDNFETITWAIVSHRDEQLLASSRELDVEVRGGFNVKLSPGKEFVVMENITVYFEAYNHVLQALQGMSEKDFPPMTDFLVNFRKEVPPPSYIDPTNDTFDFTNVFRGSLKRNDCPTSFSVLKPWPRVLSEAVDFDESQMEAMEHALQHEIALIQGPPGTGKTFIGLKIMQALLDNTENRIKKGPILVVCYTNHALDQFLEGIYHKNTERIVRIGARSQSDVLKDRTMTRLLSAQQPYRDYYGARRVLIEQRDELRAKFREQVDILNNNFSVHWRDVVAFLSASQRSKFEFGFGSVDVMDAEQWQEHQWQWLTSTPELVLAPLRSQSALRHSPRTNEGMEEDWEDDEALKELLETERWEREEEEKNPQAKAEVFQLDSSWLEESKDKVEHNPRWREESNLWDMSAEDRRETYRQWAMMVQEQAFERLSFIQNQLDLNSEAMRELERDRQLSVLRENKVVGMTTTAVSKYQTLLKRLRPSIVVVEEAAEVLEAHILAALHADTSHIILIGDHQQLRPSTAVYRLAKQFDLDVSMFERLIHTGTRYITLSHQRRMRPEISQLISPIYPQLQNHPVVTQYPHVRGVKKNLFFIEHDVPESVDNFSHSKSNTFEVEWITQLCVYFINQGYNPNQITVLSPYLGQVRSLRNAIRRSNARDVRVTAVDNFQGEENDIILLSLVRCNAENSMGFLAVPNRVCVSLSRAKIGMFIIGCRRMLEQNRLWAQVFAMLQASGCVGPSLEVGCRQHNEGIMIESAAELREKCPHGGCTELCGGDLLCGHPCKLYCHPVGHESIECTEVCGKTLSCGHECVRKCSECFSRKDAVKGLHAQRCGICLRNVTKTLACGHEVIGSCGKSSIECPAIVRHKFADCDHEISVTCGSRTARKCRVNVERVIPCGHTVEMECGEDIYSSKVQRRCTKPCGVKMSCNHICQGECKKCFRSKEHPECERCLNPPAPQVQGPGKKGKKKKKH